MKVIEFDDGSGEPEGHLIMEFTTHALSEIMDRAFEHGRGGGSFSDMSVKIIEMTPKQFAEVPEL